jgi:uncharacterized membrane protein
MSSNITSFSFNVQDRIFIGSQYHADVWSHATLQDSSPKPYVYTLLALSRKNRAMSPSSERLALSLLLFLLAMGQGASFTSYTSIFQSNRRTSHHNKPKKHGFVGSRQSLPTHHDGSRLQLHLLSNPAVAAGATLALVSSSLVGLQLDQRIPSGAGILGSMLMASLLTNLFPTFIPSNHPIYDLCWTLFLPASLTLMLLATDDHENDLLGNTTIVVMTKINQKDDSSSSITSCIRRVSGPFAMACIGSLIGCWTSFHLAVQSKWFSSIEQARLVAACISASYVGGSVNCFSTARIVGASSDLMSSLATADLLCMAVYFSGLSASLNWTWLRSKFQKDPPARSVLSTTTTPISTDEDKLNTRQMEEIMAERMAGIAVSFNRDSAAFELLSKFKAAIPLLVITVSIVQFANRIEKFASRWIPGTACAAIAVLAPWFQSQVKKRAWWRPLGAMANPLASFCFFMFFASIGVGASNLRQSFLATGPACLLFALLSLMIHFAITLAGSLLLSARGGKQQYPVEMEDVWIASNAAIGGPVTAAAFCQRMRKDNPAKLKGRTIAATVWGVVGYAIGTMLGVGMYKVLGGSIA